VVCQTFSDYEYLIIDGNSTDGSVAIIKQYADAIHYWVSEPDKGIYSAMNKGIAKATGEYVIFMNSGDCFIHENTLKNVFSTEHTADLLVGNVIVNGKYFKIRETISHKITFYYFMVNPICHQATFTKRRLFDEIGGYDEQLKISSDWKFVFLATMKYNKNIEIINEDIAWVDATGISASEEAGRLIKKEQDETIKQYFPYLYDDYKELYRLKRFSAQRLKNHLFWRFRKIFY
jgi:glycosyltransferase involved in cell wall biosynthesis